MPYTIAFASKGGAGAAYGEKAGLTAEHSPAPPSNAAIRHA